MASPNEKTPTKRKRENMTEQHIQILCAYVREKRSVLFGKPLSPTDRVSDQRKQAWENIAKQLSATGCPRSGDDVRKAWSDLKKRAKNEDDKKKTGGGSYRFKPMLEEVLLTISDKALHGIKGQKSETGATQPCSQNTEACNLLHQMGQVEDDDVERLGDGEEDLDQDQENPPPQKKKKFGITRKFVSRDASEESRSNAGDPTRHSSDPQCHVGGPSRICEQT
ncbi:uncharacterized protein LOC121405847 [Lytechinus variegatus]|uniref:uncharacterized protein LOC121405847 n=1 Tax=Lytechinus variegatus TaxID=7654 RepID=UPI001BB2BE75|nr:uncharacterized protein LOC121405847 [Lytechinus variegatus]